MSFTNDFSTILRTTRLADLGVEVHRLDANGRDPLPRYLADAKVLFPSLVLEEKREGGAYEVVGGMGCEDEVDSLAKTDGAKVGCEVVGRSVSEGEVSDARACLLESRADVR